MSALPAAARSATLIERLSTDREDVVRAGVVCGLGLASTFVYLLLTVRMSFIEFFPGPGITLDFVKMLGPDWQANSAFLLTSFAGLFVLYGGLLGMVSAAHGRLTLTALFVVPVVFVVVLTFMYPPMSVDFIHNVSDARTLFRFGDNPMVTPPDANPFPVGQSYGGAPAPYGPLWFVLLFPVVLAGESVQAALHILKFYNGLYYLGSALLIYLIVRKATPGRELFALALYAWNPFVVYRAVGNGHNDIVMVFFVLLALWLLVEQRWRFVLPALAAGVLVKYVPVIVVPPILLAGYFLAPEPRAYLREMAIGGALSLLFTLLVLAPLWEGKETFETIREQGTIFITSTPLIIREELIFKASVAPDTASRVARWAGIGAFALAYVGLLFAYWRSRRGSTELFAVTAVISLAFALLAISWYRPWYMLWPLALLPLAPGRWSLALIFVVSMGGMFPDLIEQYRLNFSFFREHYLWAIAAPVIPAFVPAVMVLIAGWLISKRWLLVGEAEQEQKPRHLNSSSR